MLPVSLSLLGAKLKAQSHLFLGWFGPRGLASILFALLMVEEFDTPTTDLIFSVILATVFFSIFLHGMTASPFAAAYGQFISKKESDIHEKTEVDEMPVKNFHTTN